MNLQAHRVSAETAETPQLSESRGDPNIGVVVANGVNQSLPQPRDHNTSLRRCHSHD
jgi:hypothetical protein